MSMTKWYMGFDGAEYPDSEIGVDTVEVDETPEQEQERETSEAAFRDYLEISPLISKAGKRYQYWDLGDHIGPDPLEALEKALERALSEVREIKNHQHQWNEDDYCDICGRDGRV